MFFRLFSYDSTLSLNESKSRLHSPLLAGLLRLIKSMSGSNGLDGLEGPEDRDCEVSVLVNERPD